MRRNAEQLVTFPRTEMKQACLRNHVNVTTFFFIIEAFISRKKVFLLHLVFVYADYKVNSTEDTLKQEWYLFLQTTRLYDKYVQSHFSNVDDKETRLISWQELTTVYPMRNLFEYVRLTAWMLLQFSLVEWHKRISNTSFFTLVLVEDAHDKFSYSICAVVDLA